MRPVPRVCDICLNDEDTLVICDRAIDYGNRILNVFVTSKSRANQISQSIGRATRYMWYTTRCMDSIVCPKLFPLFIAIKKVFLSLEKNSLKQEKTVLLVAVRFRYLRLRNPGKKENRKYPNYLGFFHSTFFLAYLIIIDTNALGANQFWVKNSL